MTITMSNVHLAGSFHSISSPCCFSGISGISEWIVDTGATDHITPFLVLFHNPKPISFSILLPNGNTSPITHIGTADTKYCST